MKKNAFLMAAGLSMLASSAMALNPVNGWYAGFIGSVSFMPKLQFSLLNLDQFTNYPAGAGLPGTVIDGEVNYKVMGGGGGQIGYRWCDNYRAETEVIFITNEYNSIKIGDYTIKRANSIDAATGLNQNGHTNIWGALVNVYYDFYRPAQEGNYVPYVGLGLGYASVQNLLVLNYNGQQLQPRLSYTNSTAAGQAIIGVSYFLDDFTSFNLDYRYFSTQNFSKETRYSSFNQRFAVHTISFSMNFAFDKTINV